MLQNFRAHIKKIYYKPFTNSLPYYYDISITSQPHVTAKC